MYILVVSHLGIIFLHLGLERTCVNFVYPLTDIQTCTGLKSYVRRDSNTYTELFFLSMTIVLYLLDSKIMLEYLVSFCILYISWIWSNFLVFHFYIPNFASMDRKVVSLNILGFVYFYMLLFSINIFIMSVARKQLKMETINKTRIYLTSIVNFYWLLSINDITVRDPDFIFSNRTWIIFLECGPRCINGKLLTSGTWWSQ